MVEVPEQLIGLGLMMHYKHETQATTWFRNRHRPIIKFDTFPSIILLAANKTYSEIRYQT